MTLRFGPLRIHTTVRWPRVDTVSIALVLTDELSPADAWVESCIVVGLAGGMPGSAELAALHWVSEHVGEFGAERDRMLVAGGARAARLALAARDSGWPVLRRQVLVHPSFTQEQPMPASVAGAPPATVVFRGGAGRRPPLCAAAARRWGRGFTRCAMLATVGGVLASGHHRAELSAYCRRMLGSSFDAEDAVQETLLRAWRSSGRFEGRAPIRSWLYRIATNVCLDALAHTARRPVPVDEVPVPVDPSVDPPGQPEDPSDRALAREDLRLAIIAAMGNLPPRQRAVLMLRDVLSWHASEVAELLGTTPTGVNSPLQRARATLESIEPERVSNRADPAGGELVGRYLAAFAADDVDALVALARGS
jgi:RNA polymerase sigma factor (sigma-70 family)